MGIVLVATISIILALLSVFFIMLEYYVGVIGYIKGAPFVPSKPGRIKIMIELADIKEGMTVVDLGSGDGSIVIAAAQHGAYAIGIEMNPFLVPYSRWRARRAHVEDHTIFIRDDIRNYSLHDTNIVFLYLLPSLLAKIKSKLLSELKPGSRIISNAFAIPGLTPCKEKDGVFVYIIKPAA